MEVIAANMYVPLMTQGHGLCQYQSAPWISAAQIGDRYAVPPALGENAAGAVILPGARSNELQAKGEETPQFTHHFPLCLPFFL